MLLYLYRFRSHTHFRPEGLKALSDYVASATRLAFHRFTPIVGDNAFAYELANQHAHHEIYEDYPPELVGGRRELVLGTKGDPVTVQKLAEEFSIDLAHASRLVAEAVMQTRRPVRLDEFPKLLQEERNHDPH